MASDIRSDHSPPPEDPPPAGEAVSVSWSGRRRFQHRYWLHALLFGLTLVTTTLVGGLHYESFLSDFGTRRVAMTLRGFLAGGLWYSLTLLAILGAHEAGHYLMCRRHRVDATLPYFLPAPLPLTGTVGAFIRIREPFPDRRILFDIAAAGPFAGFAVLVPALFVGLRLSEIQPLPADFRGFSLGEPPFFRLASLAVWGPIADGYSINAHPMVFASWFGLLATAVNLLPFGQLDGGHIAYAALGRRAVVVSAGTVIAAVGLTFVSASWVMTTVMLVVLLFTLGPHHPPVLYGDVPLDRRRRLLAALAAILFVLCFTPAPIEPYELLKRP
ncbi:MAG TPA: site-2 protease family protein [Vicinamibacterales bacterium]|nr:site-2 protease family protein [Vicinamibacterales bacterium]